MYSSSVQSLLSEGSKLYSAKEYDSASEKYAEACEEFNQENDKDDADLLFLYGKSLFQSAVANNEVFGGAKAPGGPEEKEEGEAQEEGDNFQFADDAPLAEEEDEEEDENDEQNEEQGPIAAEEDDEDDDSEEDGESGEQNGEGEEQSDFEVAWEILDLTRSIWETQLEEQVQKQETPVKSPYLQSDDVETQNPVIILTKKLADTYDLLGEVSLESENFTQSAVDLQKCLELRQKLYNPETSSAVTESHYKLSLALEFCVEDEKLKPRAIHHLKEAIRLVGARNTKETDDEKRKDNEELVQDLQTKLDELEKEEEPDFDQDKLEILKGILGQSTGSTGATSAASSAVVNDLTASIIKQKKVKPTQVNDLSSMVKKRKAPKDSAKDAGIKKDRK